MMRVKTPTPAGKGRGEVRGAKVTSQRHECARRPWSKFSVGRSRSVRPLLVEAGKPTWNLRGLSVSCCKARLAMPCLWHVYAQVELDGFVIGLASESCCRFILHGMGDQCPSMP